MSDQTYKIKRILFENAQSIFVLFCSPLYEASFSAMSLVGCPCVVRVVSLEFLLRFEFYHPFPVLSNTAMSVPESEDTQSRLESLAKPRYSLRAVIFFRLPQASSLPRPEYYGRNNKSIKLGGKNSFQIFKSSHFNFSGPKFSRLSMPIPININ